MTPVHLALGLVTALASLYAWRGRRSASSVRSDAPDTPTTELIEALTQQAGQPMAYSVSTLDDGSQVLILPADDPVGAATIAHQMELPALRIVADVDGGSVQLYPHPDRLTGLCALYSLVEGELVELATAPPVPAGTEADGWADGWGGW